MILPNFTLFLEFDLKFGISFDFFFDCNIFRNIICEKDIFLKYKRFRF